MEISQETKSSRQNKRPDKKEKKPTPMDLLKLEIAGELGLSDKVKQEGWGGLTSAESGRIGGIITQRAKKGLIDLTALRSTNSSETPL
ncbi:Small, acid-soluble spore protein, alpha/beta type [Desulforamulus aeronauticus DSM 10349]|uniref:Small, acid-soluble spore protein, alpha/beta type n=2 Tax=Desulforamulus aeronauticus TaxID=53343 RepID=A0A1M6PN99_9FIRM|nr:Small, acid-soluble spore protein, alpha/beta type [Desulforamulus aeronauticus DSM 10349]